MPFMFCHWYFDKVACHSRKAERHCMERWQRVHCLHSSTPPTNGFYMFSTAKMDPTSISGRGSKLNTTPANGATAGFYDGFTSLGRYVLGAGVGGYILEGATGSYLGFLANAGITNLHIGGGYLWLMRNAGPPRLLQRVKIDAQALQGALKPSPGSSPGSSSGMSGARATRSFSVFVGGFAGALVLVLKEAC